MPNYDFSQPAATDTPSAPAPASAPKNYDFSGGATPSGAPLPLPKPKENKAKEPFLGSASAYLDRLWDRLSLAEADVLPSGSNLLSPEFDARFGAAMAIRGARVDLDALRASPHIFSAAWTGIKDVPNEISSQFTDAVKMAGEGVKQTWAGKTKEHGVLANAAIGEGKIAIGAANALYSPVGGLIDATIGKPLSEATAKDADVGVMRSLPQFVAPLGWERAVIAFKSLPALQKVKFFGQAWDLHINPHEVSPEAIDAANTMRQEHALKAMRENRQQKDIEEASNTAFPGIKEAVSSVYHNDLQAAADHIVGYFGDAMNFAPETVRLNFIHALESGDLSKIPEKYHPLAVKLSQIFVENRRQIEQLGVDEKVNWIEHYFPHLWENKEEAAAFAKDYIEQTMSAEGRAGFLEDREFDMFEEGIKAGLKPVSTNPILISLIRTREVQRYVMANRVLRSFHDKGLAKWIPEGESIPDGFTELDDKIAKARFTDINPYERVLHGIKQEVVFEPNMQHKALEAIKNLARKYPVKGEPDPDRALARVADEHFDELPDSVKNFLRGRGARDFETGETHRIGEPTDSPMASGNEPNIHGAHIFDLREEAEQPELQGTHYRFTTSDDVLNGMIEGAQGPRSPMTRTYTMQEAMMEEGIHGKNADKLIDEVKWWTQHLREKSASSGGTLDREMLMDDKQIESLWDTPGHNEQKYDLLREISREMRRAREAEDDTGSIASEHGGLVERNINRILDRVTPKRRVPHIYHIKLNRSEMEGRSLQDMLTKNETEARPTLDTKADKEYLIPKDQFEKRIEYGIKTDVTKDGQWVVQKDANALLHRYFSPGLFEKSGWIGSTARGLRMINNLYNQAQLGFSLFHLGFVTLDSMASNTALVAKLISKGRFGQAAKVGAETPFVPALYAKRGGHLMYYYDNAVIDTIDAKSEVNNIIGGFIKGSTSNRKRRFMRYVKNETTAPQSRAALKAITEQARTQAVIEGKIPARDEGTYEPTERELAAAIEKRYENLPSEVKDHLQAKAVGSENIINTLKKDASLKTHLENYGPIGKGPQELDQLEALISAGGQAKRPKVYSSRLAMPWQEEYRMAIQASGLKTILGRLKDTKERAGHAFRGTLGVIGAAEDNLMAPLFQAYVPRMKLGVFISHSQAWLEKNPHATYAQMSTEMGKIWDSVENRLGEMDLDRRFWNQSLKDAAVIGLRAVGWNYGTVHELGGGGVDLRELLENGKMTYRTSYLFGLATETAILGSMLTYINTGHSPRQLKDYFFPPDGKGGRMAPPTYAKEIYEVPLHPFQSIGNKLGPFWSNLYSTLVTDQDFYGGEVYHRTDPLKKRLEETIKYWLGEFLPFSMQSYARTNPYSSSHKSRTQYGLSYLTSPSNLGFVKAPKSVERGEKLTNEIIESKDKRAYGRAIQEGRMKPGGD